MEIVIKHPIEEKELKFKDINPDLKFSSSNGSFCFFENYWNQLSIYGGEGVKSVRKLCEAKSFKILGYLDDVPEFGTKEFEYSQRHLNVTVLFKDKTEFLFPGYFFKSTVEEFEKRLKNITFTCLDKVTKENMSLKYMSYNPQQIACNSSSFLDEYLQNNPEVDGKKLIGEMIDILKERRDSEIRFRNKRW